VEPRTRLRLRVVPGAGRAGFVGRYGAAWKVRVTAPPERGLANDAVLKLLSDTLALPVASISLVSGHGGRDKIVELAGITEAELESRLVSAERKEVS
jgi:uncharacterized protein YggU (UPF0235/DUF167 family)